MSLFFIKAWSLFQLVVLVFLILFFSITRFFRKRAIKRSLKNKQKIKQLLDDINDNPNVLTAEIIKFFNRRILELILCMEEMEKNNFNNPNWNRTKKLLSESVLKNRSVKLARSKRWFKKQLTLLCYEFGDHIQDEKTLLKFVKDDNLIISINAAIELFKNPDPSSINEVITIFSEGRHILHTTFAAMLTNIPFENIDLIRTIFIARLNVEKNIYMRIFCYRVLIHIEPSDKIDSFVEKDLLSENIDLKILALKYMEHIDPTKSIPVLLGHLNDTDFEVRSTVVRLLGDTGDKSVIPYLKDKLRDREWWVRINSANGLFKLGQEGIAVLNQQSPEIDKFAYETAQVVLKIHQYTN